MIDITTPSAPTRPTGGRDLTPIIAWVGVVFAIVLITVIGHPHPHRPDWSLLSRQPPMVWFHLGAALAALGLGVVMMAAPKGTLPHRTLGWIWVMFIMTVAGSSLFIRGINRGGFSPIHILSAWVLFIVPVAVIAARRHHIETHRRSMTGVFYLGLILAGVFTLFPGRLLWRVFLG